MATELTAERLREQIDYDRVSGFTWRVSGNGRVAGERAGSPSSDGTLVISIDGIRYKAHKLAVLHVTGEWPKRVVRYIDGNRGNCAWENLREAPGPKPTIKQRNGRGVYRERGAWRVEVIDGNGPTYRNGPFTKQSHAEADRLATIKIRATLAADPKAAIAKERMRVARWFRSRGYGGHPTPPYYVRVPLELRPNPSPYYFDRAMLGPYGSEEEAAAVEALPPEEIKRLAEEEDRKYRDRINQPYERWWLWDFEDDYSILRLADTPTAKPRITNKPKMSRAAETAHLTTQQSRDAKSRSADWDNAVSTDPKVIEETATFCPEARARPVH